VARAWDIYIYKERERDMQRERERMYIKRDRERAGDHIGLYKMLFCLWAFVHESVPFSTHPPFV